MFKDSSITNLTPWMALEESTSLPANIFPAYIGSGDLIVSLDASGLQGLNHGVQEAFSCVPDAGDMYVVKHGMVGDVISKNNVLPFGYLDWKMELDGEKIDSSNLQKSAFVWSRKIYIDEGRVVTRMLLKTHLILEICAWIPYGSLSPVFEISLKGYDCQNKQIKEPRIVKFEIGINLKTRQGKLIYNECKFDGSLLHLLAEGHETYRFAVMLDNNLGLKPEYKDERLALTWNTQVADEEQKLACVFSFNNQIAMGQLEALRTANCRGWHEYYRNAGDVTGIDIKEEFLYHNSLYLMKACFNYDYGLPIGMPFFFPWCWSESTFWDSHFVIESLIQAGVKDAADKFIDFLYKSMRKDGKPFPWMFIYDGTSTIDDSRDMAPLVIATHAMTAIKYYEYYEDDIKLSERVFPICKAVSDYAVDKLFSKVDGKWILSSPVSNDVVDEEATEINQSFTILWFLVVIKKTLEYAGILGEQKTLDSRYDEILKEYHIDHVENEYLHSRGVKASEHHCTSWIPFLLFPTEGMPFVDMELFRKTREKYCFTDLYLEKQGDFQPWTDFIQASSDFRLGAVEEGYRIRQIGISHAYGPGFFSEVGPRQETCGLPPYISAHGSYISALMYQFFTISIWEKKIGIFSAMPLAYRDKKVRVRDMHSTGNIRLTAEYGPLEIKAEIDGNLKDFIIEMPAPHSLEPENMRVLVNGCIKPFRYSKENRKLEVNIDEECSFYTVSVR